jgi:hypothetical protein
MILTGSEREQAINEARRGLCSAVLEAIAYQYTHIGTYSASLTDRVDEAAKVLADELRKPETCFACHQEVGSR